MGRKIAIIGTAGRDKNFPMNARHWDFMCNMVSAELEPDDHLIYGGAAWAAHRIRSHRPARRTLR